MDNQGADKPVQELWKALNVLKKFCGNYTTCKNCMFYYDGFYSGCRLTDTEPCNWELDNESPTMFKED